MMSVMRMGGRDTRGHVGLIYLTLSICGIGGALFLSRYFNLGAVNRLGFGAASLLEEDGAHAEALPARGSGKGCSSRS